MRKIFNFWLLVFGLSIGQVSAQNVKFTASASQTRVATGQQFVIQYSLNANGDGFDAPNLSAFSVLSGPNQSTSMSFINGKMSAEQSFSFYLMATKEGTYIIEPAKIQYNGKTLKTNVLKIEVVKGATVPQSNRSAGNPSSDENWNDEAYDGKDVFVRLEVNKSKVYKGEPLIATYRLYTRVNIVNNDMEKMPELNGFWSKDLLNLNGNVQWQLTTVNGERYNVAVLKKTMLFPLHSGKLKIDPWKMDLVIRKEVRGNSGSIFDQFFGSYQDQKVKVSSNSASIEVLPLPEKGKPSDFDGMVGNYNLTWKIDKQKLKANEAANLTITLSGNGNLKLIDAPKLDFPDDFEVYDPDIQDKFSVVDGNLSGSRTFNYLIIPRNPGKYELDPIHFSYFNPKNKSYQAIHGEKMVLEVGKGNPDAATQFGRYSNKQEVNTLGNDIRYIKVATNFKEESHNGWNSVSFWIWICFPILMLVGAWLFKKKQERDENDIDKRQLKKMNRLVNRYLGQAKKSLQAKDKNVFYQSVLSAMDNYLSIKLGLNASQLTEENVQEELVKRGVSEELIKNWKTIKSECEEAQYAPVISESNGQILFRVAEMIQKLEKTLKNG